jgi:hypothetical protein
MPTAAERASRLRQTLRERLADYQQRLEDLLPLRLLLKGSVYELKTRCGKPSCHCAAPEGPLHSSTVLSWSERGKTRLRTLPAGDTAHLRRLAENHRRFRQDRAALVKLHRQILLAIDRLRARSAATTAQAGGTKAQVLNGSHRLSLRPQFRARRSAPRRDRLSGTRLGSRRGGLLPSPHPAASCPTPGRNLSHTAQKFR